MRVSCSTSFCSPQLWVVPLVLGFFLIACEGEVPEAEEEAPEDDTHEQALTAIEEEEGFEHLFNGTDLDDWRGFQQEEVPEGWGIDEEGALAVTDGEPDADLITRETYEDFDLRLEFQVPEEGNSGIFYMVAEDDFEQAWHTGPEYQILDDENVEDVSEEQLTASNYDVMAPDLDVFEEAGTWQSARIVKEGDTVQHWLNDELVLTYELESPEWHGHVEQSKFVEHPDYAQHEDGHIGLQYHGDDVRFRNIRVNTQ